mgnify:CR=1 FL=1
MWPLRYIFSILFHDNLTKTHQTCIKVRASITLTTKPKNDFAHHLWNKFIRLSLIPLTLLLLSCGGGGSSPVYVENLDTSVSEGNNSNGSCPQTNWSSGNVSIDHNGIERKFRVYISSNYKSDTPASLVLGFHGWSGNENEFLNNQTVRDQLDEYNYIMISPLGLGSGEPDSSYASWSFRGSTTGLDGDGINQLVVNDSEKICDTDSTPDYTYQSCAGIAENTCSWTQCLDDDVSFVSFLVAQAQENLCIDADRIFATGGSNGGMFVWELGQNENTANIFRAVAPIIGLPHRGYLDGPKKPNGLSAILVTGMRDTTVPPGDWDDKSFTTTSNGEAFYYTGASAIAEKWAIALDCDVSIPPKIVDLDTASTLECRGWDNCRDTNSYPSILDCRGAKMGHTYNLDDSWPLIMDFFNDR